MFYAKKHDVPRIIIGIFVFMVFTNNFIMQIVVFTGAFDIVFDFRRLRRPVPPSVNSDRESNRCKHGASGKNETTYLILVGAGLPVSMLLQPSLLTGVLPQA